MGGAVGHLMHLHDDLDLRFKDIIDILKAASAGKLQNVTEKFDGLNLVFSWNSRDNSLRVARSAGDIKRGGMDADSLAKKFADRGNLSATFNSAFSTIEAALRGISNATKRKIFGPSANRWYSMEIIDSKDPNVIHYDVDAIIFHSWPTFEMNSTGQTKIIEGETFVTSLLDEVKDFSSPDWKLMGPVAVARSTPLAEGIIIETISKIKTEMSNSRLRSTNTLRDYVKRKLQHDVTSLGLPLHASDMMVQRCMSEPDSPTLVDIKKISDKSDHKAIIEFVKSSEKRLKAYARPIELIINEFAVKLLEGTGSKLVSNPSLEIERLQAETIKAIRFIERCDDPMARDILHVQLEKLRFIENVSSALEGIVFLHAGTAYKFTGSFAPVGQILGLFKYGRGGVKLQMAS